MSYSSANTDYYVAITKQSAKGTSATSGFTKIDITSGSDPMAHEMDEIEQRSMRTGKNPGRSIKGAHKIGGSFPLLAQPDIIAQLWSYALGSCSVTPATTAAPAIHVITASDTLPYLSIATKYVVDEFATDCRIKEIKVTGEAAQEIKMDVTWLGCSVEKITADDTAGVSAADYQDDYGDTFKYAGGTYTIDNGLESTDIRNYSITYTNEFDEDLITTTQTRNDLPFLRRMCPVEFTLVYEDQDLWDKVYYGATAATTVSAGFYSGGQFTALHTHGSGTATKEYQMDIGEVVVTDAKITGIDPDGKTIELAVVGKGFVSTATNTILAVTAKNTNDTSYLA